MISELCSLYRATSARQSRRFLSQLRNSNSLIARFSVLAMLLCGAGSTLSGQTVTGNFGPVNVGTTSSVIPLVFTFETSATLTSTTVLTLGAAGLDFADAGSDTCAANTTYTAGQSCTVNVSFTPRFAGSRIGAVVLQDKIGRAHV